MSDPAVPSIEGLDRKLDLLAQEVRSGMAALRERLDDKTEEQSRQAEELGRRIGALEQSRATQDVTLATLAGQVNSASRPGPNWSSIISAAAAVGAVAVVLVDKIAH